MMFPVVKLLQPGSFIDSFFGTEGSSVVEAVQVREAGEELRWIVHAVDAELQLIDVMGIQMEGGLLSWSKAAVGAEIERDRAGGQRPHGTQQRQQQDYA